MIEDYEEKSKCMTTDSLNIQTERDLEQPNGVCNNVKICEQVANSTH